MFQAEAELLIFYSLLPLTENEVLLSCKTEALTSSVVQYSKTSKNIGVKLKDDGQYCIISVPGNGIVATLYQADIYNRKGKKQVVPLYIRNSCYQFTCFNSTYVSVDV